MSGILRGAGGGSTFITTMGSLRFAFIHGLGLLLSSRNSDSRGALDGGLSVLLKVRGGEHARRDFCTL